MNIKQRGLFLGLHFIFFKQHPRSNLEGTSQSFEWLSGMDSIISFFRWLLIHGICRLHESFINLLKYVVKRSTFNSVSLITHYERINIQPTSSNTFFHDHFLLQKTTLDSHQSNSTTTRRHRRQHKIIYYIHFHLHPLARTCRSNQRQATSRARNIGRWHPHFCFFRQRQIVF